MASDNIKAIKRRMKSVETTKQITKAMQLVAASKLKKAKEKAENVRPYFDLLYDTMCEIQAESKEFFSPFKKNGKKGNVLLVVIAGDRGLAGGFNSAILKAAKERADEISKNGRSVEILAIGKKSAEHFRNRNFRIFGEYSYISENIKITKASRIADKIVYSYLKGEFEKVELFYTDFASALSQVVCSKQILPVEISESDLKSKGRTSSPIYEPSAEAVFDSIIPKYLTGIIFSAVVDSYAAETAARRNAMENAADNADEILSTLSLKYNRARQASITQELTEIVSGSIGEE